MFVFNENIITPNIVIDKIGFKFLNSKGFEIILGENVLKINSKAFDGYKLTKVTMTDSVTDIENYAFCGNNIQKLILSNRIKIIEKSCFADNRITSIFVPDTVIYIGNKAFETNNVVQINILEDNEIINIENNVIISNSVTKIDDYAFANNPLKFVTLSNKSIPKDCNIFQEFTRIFGHKWKLKLKENI